MKSVARALAVVLVLVPLSGASALQWSEYRRISPDRGVPYMTVIGDTSVFIGGDTSIIRKFDGNNLELMISDEASRHLEFNRVNLGRLVLLVTPSAPANIGRSPALSRLADTSAAPQSEQMPSRDAVSSRAPRRDAADVDSPEDPRMPEEPLFAMPAPSARTAPPILIPPPPHALVTPPTMPASGERLAAHAPAPASAFTREPSADVTRSGAAATESVSAPAAARAVPRDAPSGANRPVDTSFFTSGLTKPGEQQLYSLSEDLLARGLYTDAIAQFEKFQAAYPRSALFDMVSMKIGDAYARRGAWSEQESFRQRDLRRSAIANEFLEAAIVDYAKSSEKFKEVVARTKNPDLSNLSQLKAAAALHGLVRSQFQKGGIPEDSPSVIVEYLRSFVGGNDTANTANARLGIAQYYRDLGDARMAARMDSKEIHDAYDRAVREYLALIDHYDRLPAVEDALMDLAKLFDRNLEMRRFEESVKHYEELIKRFPGGRFADEARGRALWIRENYL